MLMKALVLYESMFGNTRNVAEAIGRGIAAVVDELGFARDLAGIVDVRGPAAMLHDHQIVRARV